MKKKKKATGVLVNTKSLKDDQIDEALDEALDALFGVEEKKPGKKAGSTKRETPGKKNNSGNTEQ